MVLRGRQLSLASTGVRHDPSDVGHDSALWQGNEIKRAATDEMQLTAVGKYERESRVAHPRFTGTVQLVCERDRQTKRAFRDRRNMFNVNVLLARVILRPDSPRVDVRLGVDNVRTRNDSTRLQRSTAWPVLQALCDARNNGFPLGQEVIRERRICLASSLIWSAARYLRSA